MFFLFGLERLLSFFKKNNMGEERGRVGIDAEVCKQRMERSMTDQNGCPGMHVLVSIPPVVMLTDPPPYQCSQALC